LKEQLSEALEANELLSESIVLQNSDISHQVGSQEHTGNLVYMDVSDECQKTQQVCLFYVSCSKLFKSAAAFFCYGRYEEFSAAQISVLSSLHMLLN
jgi:hypothetical protein